MSLSSDEGEGRRRGGGGGGQIKEDRGEPQVDAGVEDSYDDTSEDDEYGNLGLGAVVGNIIISVL